MSRTYRSPMRHLGRYWWRPWKIRRDAKPWFKAPRWYKTIKERRRRKAVRMAVHSGKEPPIFRRTNDWLWS